MLRSQTRQQVQLQVFTQHNANWDRGYDVAAPLTCWHTVPLGRQGVPGASLGRVGVWCTRLERFGFVFQST